MSAILDYQLASEHPHVPAEESIQAWVDYTFTQLNTAELELTVRVVDEIEACQLNNDYRQRNYATNVLSFPFEAPPGVEMNFIGDLVICAAVVEREASEQKKELNHHWAHMVIHGTLHLLGYDHIDPQDADEMESLEVEILNKLGIDDPYQDSE